MPSFSKIQERGQVTLPKEVRERAGVNPGDTVLFTVSGPGKITLEVHETRPLEWFWERYSTDRVYDEQASDSTWHARAAEDVLEDE